MTLRITLLVLVILFINYIFVQMSSSLKYVKDLAPYDLRETGATTDPYVETLIRELLPSALPSLSSYSRGLYSTERHIASFMKYDIPMETLHAAG